MDEFGYFYFKDRTGDTFRYVVSSLSMTDSPCSSLNEETSGGSSQVEAPSGRNFGAHKLKLEIEVARNSGPYGIPA
jgi:hypothetical protein